MCACCHRWRFCCSHCFFQCFHSFQFISFIAVHSCVYSMDEQNDYVSFVSKTIENDACHNVTPRIRCLKCGHIDTTHCSSIILRAFAMFSLCSAQQFFALHQSFSITIATHFFFDWLTIRIIAMLLEMVCARSVKIEKLTPFAVACLNTNSWSYART